MDEKLQARRGGKTFRLTLDAYWALPEKERVETELLIDGEWARPERFIEQGSGGMGFE